MKTKFILSLVAVLFAVAGALTTNAAKARFVNKVAVTLPGAASCQQTGVCDTDVAGDCMVNTTDIYKLRQPNGPGFSCSVNATGIWSSN